MRIGPISFRGEMPRITPRELPENAAQIAANCRLQTGDLEAWKHFAFEKTLANAGSPVRTIYKLFDKWLSWEQQVDVARGVVPDDDSRITFITSPGLYSTPRFTTYALATTGAEPFPVLTRPLGVPGPSTAPTLVVSADTGGTFAVNVTDDGTELATAWTTSPPVSGGGVTSTVTQDSDGYTLTYEGNEGNAAWLKRNFGISAVAALHFETDFIFRSGDNTYQQMQVHVMNPSDGTGIAIAYTTAGVLAIVLAAGWTSRSGSAVAVEAIGALAYDTTFKLKVDLSIRSDGTRTVTARVYDSTGTTPQGDAVTATVSAPIGDFCGFVAESSNVDATDEFSTSYKNIVVTGSGAALIINSATTYLYTFVNDLGWESVPSPLSEEVTRPDGVAVTVTTPVTAPSGYDITNKRIYRVVVGATGAVYRLVTELPLATADFVDNLTDEELPKDVLESDEWDMPPDDLEGIIPLPNGMMAGFRKNQLCLSVPNRPFAWPVRARYPTDTKIVAISNIDNTVVIGTEKFLYTATGNDCFSYSMSQPGAPQACSSKRGMIYLDGIGVAYPSPDGYMACSGSASSVRNLTEPYLTKEQWEALDPTSIIAAVHDATLHFFYSGTGGAGGKMLDVRQSGFGMISLSYQAVAAHVDPVTDKLYLVLASYTSQQVAVDSFSPTNQKTIYAFNAHATDRMPYRWKGRLNLMPYPTTMHFGRVRAESYSNVSFRVYANGTLIKLKVPTDDKAFRVPGTKAYNSYEVDFFGTSRVYMGVLGEDNGEVARAGSNG